MKDREHRWVLLNDSMCKFIGLPRAKLIGKSDFDFVPAEQAEIFWTIDDRVFLTGEENENEEEHTDLNGNVRTIVTRKRLVHVGERHARCSSPSSPTSPRSARRRRTAATSPCTMR